MRPENSGSATPDDDWPDDEADDQGAPTWPAAPARSYGQPERRHRRPLAVTAVAVAALAVGAGGAAAITHELPQAAPSASAPTPAASGGEVFPGGGTVPGGSSSSGTARLFAAGRVLAVTPTSITIGGPAHRVRAAVTAATKVTGRVTSISKVKVGDQVSAQITESGGQATATAIQDPARLP